MSLTIVGVMVVSLWAFLPGENTPDTQPGGTPSAAPAPAAGEFRYRFLVPESGKAKDRQILAAGTDEEGLGQWACGALRDRAGGPTIACDWQYAATIPKGIQWPGSFRGFSGNWRPGPPLGPHVHMAEPFFSPAGADRGTMLYGTTDSEVASVTIALVHGETTSLPIVRANSRLRGSGPDIGYYFLPVARDGWAGARITAFDAAGEELEGYDTTEYSEPTWLLLGVKTMPTEMRRDMRDVIDTLGYFSYIRSFEIPFEDWAEPHLYDVGTLDECCGPDVVNTDSVASVGAVSIRITAPDRVVIATKLANGTVICTAATNNNVATATFGEVDAQSPEECTGGWTFPTK